MILNRGGALTKEYFVAYMKLIMNTMECPVEEAKDIAFSQLFRSKSDTLGEASYRQFLHAYHSLK